MSDYVEMMVLSILSYGLVCDWGITKWERATLTTVINKIIVVKKSNSETISSEQQLKFVKSYINFN